MIIIFWIGVGLGVLALSILTMLTVDFLEGLFKLIDPVKENVYPVESDKFLCVSVLSLKEDPNLSKFYYTQINGECTIELYEALEIKYNAEVINLLTDSNGYRFFVMRKNK